MFFDARFGSLKRRIDEKCYRMTGIGEKGKSLWLTIGKGRVIIYNVIDKAEALDLCTVNQLLLKKES